MKLFWKIKWLILARSAILKKSLVLKFSWLQQTAYVGSITRYLFFSMNGENRRMSARRCDGIDISYLISI